MSGSEEVQELANSPSSTNSPWNPTSGYCNQQHWAIPSECKASSTNGDTCYDGIKPANDPTSGYNCDGIFCEMDWQCVSSDFSQLNIKGEQMMSFITTNKDYKKTIGRCQDPSAPTDPGAITSAVCAARGEC